MEGKIAGTTAEGSLQGPAKRGDRLAVGAVLTMDQRRL